MQAESQSAKAGPEVNPPKLVSRGRPNYERITDSITDSITDGITDGISKGITGPLWHLPNKRSTLAPCFWLHAGGSMLLYNQPRGPASCSANLII